MMQKAIIPILMFILIGLFSAQVYATDPISITEPYVNIIDLGAGAISQLSGTIVDGSNIYVIVTDINPSPTETYFAKSTDNGATWTFPPLLLFTTVDTNTHTELFLRDNGDLGVAWIEDSLNKINFIKSTDGGATWGIPTISDNDFTTTFSTELETGFAGDGDNIGYLFTKDEQGADNNEYVGIKVSNDFGVTWEDLVILHGSQGCSPTCDPFDFVSAKLVVHGMNFYAVWVAIEDQEIGGELFFSKSNDDGITWDDEFVISSGTTEIDNVFPYVLFTEDGGKLIVNYLDTETLNTQSRSANGGETWEVSTIDDGTECVDIWSIDNSGEDVGVLCLNPEQLTIQLFLSDDFGATYSLPTQLNSTLPESFDDLTSLLYEGDNMYYFATNFDESCDCQITHIGYSQDNGQTFNFDRVLSMNDTNAFIENHLFDNYFAFDEFFYYISTLSDQFVKLVVTTLSNSGSGVPDSTAPVIDTFLSQPIQLIEDSVFDDFDNVFCLDDIDGDISMLMDIDGSVNTGVRGTYFVDYTCTDEASNFDTLNVHYIVVKKSSSSGGGGTSSGSSGGIGGTSSSPPSLSDIPTLSFQESPREQGEGQSIADLFASLFDNRITEGITTPTPAQSGSSPLGASGDSTQRPNPITEFLQNLFANFFN